MELGSRWAPFHFDLRNVPSVFSAKTRRGRGSALMRISRIPSEAEEAGSSEAHRRCAVCDSPMRKARHVWCFRCPMCGFLASTLAPHIGDGVAVNAVDETRREGALLRLRQKNFERILDLLDKHTQPPRRELLEVGCAHGWFLEAAERRGYSVQGIEPDVPSAAVAASRGYDVKVGFFTGALDVDRRYDIIVFNDVFEHLPDVRSATALCRTKLRPGGLLVINLPNSDGALFRIASAMDRLGISGPYERLWQKGFPSPHLSYFNPDALSQLVVSYGFAEVHRGRLASVDVHGLWERVRYDRKAGFAGTLIVWTAVTLANPLLKMLPGDIALQIFRA
jgi:SAM-dependent methyltransferase